MIQAAPVVRWAGGKSELLDELVKRAPKDFGRYYEPFAGGAALFFRVESWLVNGKRPRLSDLNHDLMRAYIWLAHDYDAVIASLMRHRRMHKEDPVGHFTRTRRQWNDPAAPWTAIDRAAAFIYLDKSCFNGLWRVNKRGEFNVPWGKRDAFNFDVDALLAASRALRRAELVSESYQQAVHGAVSGDFVYFDPPYSGGFTAYTSDGFTAADQAELAFTMRTLVASGVQVMASNADTPQVRALYAGMRIDRVGCRRAINSDGAKRGKVNEVIITAGYAR